MPRLVRVSLLGNWEAPGEEGGIVHAWHRESLRLGGGFQSCLYWASRKTFCLLGQISWGLRFLILHCQLPLGIFVSFFFFRRHISSKFKASL